MKENRSIVTVVFNDGEYKEYEITAKPSIAGYFSREMGKTGSLSLWNDTESFVIPATSIREFSVRLKQNN